MIEDLLPTDALIFVYSEAAPYEIFGLFWDRFVVGEAKRSVRHGIDEAFELAARPRTNDF